jgi:aminomethyltransferase
MMSADAQIDGIGCHVSRSGYTGEDGFEISCKGEDAAKLWRALLADPEVKAIGLGARDSLRLEAGLCLYGHDIDTTTSPIEAGLIWSVQKRRREEGGFPGAARVQREIKDGAARVRVGIKPEGRAPAREGSAITTPDGREVGVVTSGGFGPTVNGPVAMGYVAKDVSAVGTDLHLIVRGKPLPAKVAAMPFAPQR